MKTLVCQGQAAPLHVKKLYPWRKRSPSLYDKAMYKPSVPKRRWKLNAEAKGFGNAAVTISDKKRRQSGGGGETKNDNGGDKDDKIPSEVFDRMIVRILFSVGTPMAVGLGLSYVFGILKDQHVWGVPPWLPFLTALLAIGSSGLGIAYGTLSTSLDPDKKGSLLGWEEAQKNWPRLWKEEDEK